MRCVWGSGVGPPRRGPHPRAEVYGRGQNEEEGDGMTITPEEQARRRADIDYARHSTEMEGGQSSSAAREVQEAYVRGELTLEEYVRRATDPRSRD